MSERIIAVCNRKGGVGKTTLVAGLAEVFSHRMRKKVLVIDADNQANASGAFGVKEPEFTLNDVLYGDPANSFQIVPGSAEDAIVTVSEDWDGRDGGDPAPPISLIAAEEQLAARELDTVMAREYRLKRALIGVTEQYDITLIDCPPSLGLLTLNSLAAATHALLVTEPRVNSVVGLTKIVDTIVQVQENLNPGLGFAGVVINKVLENRNDQSEWVTKIKSDFGDLVLEPMIPDREPYAKFQSASVPLSAFGATGKVARVALERLAANIWERTAE
jgi:chromosome partitioning protein